MTSPQRAGLADHLAFVLVCAITVVAFVLIISYRWRRGATLLGTALLLAGGFRAVLSDRRAGLLAIRGRSADVFAYTGFGLALVAVAATID
jgi:hypothetical protein